MATTEDFEIRALASESSKVVSAAKALKKKNRLSRKNQDKFGKLHPENIDVALVRQKQEFVRKVEVPLMTKWGELSPLGLSSVKGSGGQRKELVFPLTSVCYQGPPADSGYYGYDSDATFSQSEEGSEDQTGGDENQTSEMGEETSEYEDDMSGNEGVACDQTMSVHVMVADGSKTIPDPPTVSTVGDFRQLPQKGTLDTQTTSALPLLEVPIVTDTDDSGDFHSPPTHQGSGEKVLVKDTPFPKAKEPLSCGGEVPSTPSDALPCIDTGNISPVILQHLQDFERAFPNGWDRSKNLGRLMSVISEEFDQLCTRLDRLVVASAGCSGGGTSTIYSAGAFTVYGEGRSIAYFLAYGGIVPVSGSLQA
ncbi:hypothetical protein AVEN_178371-1 [Araneus ventricosus]|uniref:Uncharacterized protein n=1 Tax=Araneus ventricosus TaxID=182803 RepID=A0A4Y2BF73_ARAVE|nr:hypothetical protein AVEN_178371-1 [Araneus ventricosus]